MGMKTWSLLPCLLLLSLISVAQQSPSGQNAPNNAPSTASGAITVVGCVGSINGYFTLGTRRGDVYRLKGDHDALLGYNGKEVVISGTIGPTARDRTLQISTIKKVSDSCQY
jgi:hypothetical protein